MEKYFIEIREHLPYIQNFKNKALNDAYKLLDYLLVATPFQKVSIETIKEEYGGESLRVDSLLFEFIRHNIVDVTRDSFGRIITVQLRNSGFLKIIID